MLAGMLISQGDNILDRSRRKKATS
jgi:hypothetical protein